MGSRPQSAGTSSEACFSCNCARVWARSRWPRMAGCCGTNPPFCLALSAPPGGAGPRACGLPISAQPDPATAVCSQEAGRVLAPSAPGRRRTQRGLSPQGLSCSRVSPCNRALLKAPLAQGPRPGKPALGEVWDLPGWGSGPETWPAGAGVPTSAVRGVLGHCLIK